MHALVFRIRAYVRLAVWLFRRTVPTPVWRGIVVLTALMLIGTVGYPIIEGEPWTWFDGLYMTAITLLTIGYGETYPLSNPGRAFTVVLAFGGVFTLTYYASEMVRSIVTGELQDILGRNRMEQDLARLHDHTIVCGHGRMGKHVCEQLDKQHKPYVVVEKIPRPDDWHHKYGLWVQGDGTEDESLRKAGIEKAKALIAVVGSDADNTYITLSARLINPKLFIVARAEEAEAEGKLRKVGANKIISPYHAGSLVAVQAVLRPSVQHFMEMTARAEFHDLQIEEIRLQPNCQFAGKSLRETHLSEVFGVIVLGVIRPTGEVVYGPSSATVLDAGATMVVIGQRQQLDRIEALAMGNS